MKIYLVGGAVRDKLLGIPHKEKDWVVVGATPDDMIKLGYKQVGKDFPVFLHPETKEEYALARKERKTGPGYTGFEFDTSQQVTLEEDLSRRDLTINAMAEDLEGNIIDPYHGQKDLQNKMLRHVTEAFKEDPVRILRVARFAARYKHLGFTVAKETMDLMKDMVKAGEVDALVPERVWKEWERALSEKNPEAFFEVLNECGASDILFLELGHQPLNQFIIVCQKTEDSQIRFASLFISLSIEKVQAMCQRYAIQNDYRDFAFLLLALKTTSLTDEKSYLDLLRKLDAFRREERFMKLMRAYEIIGGSSDLLIRCFQAAQAIDLTSVSQLSGKEIGDYIYQEQLERIKNTLNLRKP